MLLLFLILQIRVEVDCLVKFLASLFSKKTFSIFLKKINEKKTKIMIKISRIHLSKLKNISNDITSILGDLKWQNMSREPHLTDGIGVKTALNIPYTFAKDAPRDPSLISVTSAERRKTVKTATPEKTRLIIKESSLSY